MYGYVYCMSSVVGEHFSGDRAPRDARSRAIARFVALAAALTTPAGPALAVAPATSLEVQGMIFVGSRAGVREVVLRSRTAQLQPEAQTAELNDVSAIISEDDAGKHSFTMNCERVELDIAKSDFVADGNVRGETAEGQHYSAPWVKYVHEQGLLYTDAPVEMTDSHGSFRGNGFRYHVHERRFELLGNVRVEQHP
jgi:LPS export ABC transporter protein LptC